jgi:hemoglobin/transferrin/lactoferrin receptor protein
VSSFKNPLFLGLALAAALYPASLPAEENSAAASAEVADGTTDAEGENLSYFATTTVTATGYESDSHKVPTPVTVITEPARQLPDSAADLLRQEPGVDVNGVGTNQTRPVIRGQRGLRILFLENGLRMNNPRRQTDFGEIPSLTDIESVERLEVVRGPASVLYGSDAIGGVLNLITRVPRTGEAFTGSLGLRYGSAGEQEKAHAAIGGVAGNLSYSLGYTWRETENYEAPAGSYGDARLAEDTEVLDSGVKDDSWTGYLGWRASDQHSIFLRTSRYRADQSGFGFVDNAALGASEAAVVRILYPFQNFDKYTLGYSGSALDAPFADTIDAQIYFQDNERELVNDIDINIGPIFPGAPNSFVFADTLNYTDLESRGLRAELTKVGGSRHIVTYGVDAFEDKSRNTDFSTTTTSLRFPFPPFRLDITESDSLANAPNAKNASYGVFAQDEILITDRLKAIVGLRYQNVETEAEATPGWDVTGLGFEDDNVVGAINLLYALNTEWSLVANWGTGFRAPNIIERLFNGPTPEGLGFQILNADLVAETSTNYDLGFKFQDRNAHLEFFYFRNEIEDGIVQTFLSDAEIAALPPALREEIEATGIESVVQQRNFDRLEYEGYELSGGYRWDSGFGIGGNASHLDVERNDGQPVPGGDYSSKYNAFLRYDPIGKPFRAEYRVRHNTSENVPLSPGEPPPLVGTELPAFTVHSLLASYSLDFGSLRHTLTVLGDNLTNELYAEFSNATFFRPAAKRSFSVNYTIGF